MNQDQQITIQLNGETRSVQAGTTLHALVQDVVGRRLRTDGSPEDGGRLGVAAAVSGTVVRRAEWRATELPSGARVDVVTAAQGG